MKSAIGLLQRFDAEYMGFGVDGAFAEYLAAPSKNVFKIPENLSFEEAAIMEPVAHSLHIMDFIKPSLGEVMAIIGLGPIGLVMSQTARIYGVKVVGIEPVTDRRLLGKKHEDQERNG